MLGRSTKSRQTLNNNKQRQFLLYIATIIFSIIFLVVGNKIATRDLTIFNSEDLDQTIVKARIEKILDRTSEEITFDEENTFENLTITFEATILDGKEKGETAIGVQTIDSMIWTGIPEAKGGDKILLLKNDAEEETSWYLIEYIKTDKLFIFGGFFVLALLIFGGIKGFNTIVSLGFTCAAIFVVFIPSILSGKNIYASAIIICAFTIIMTFLIINGGNKKTLAATLGCLGGIIVSGILTLIMDNALKLTGYVNQESIYLTYMSTETPIDLKAIVFAAILIGALGAIMDVAMSISSSLWEVKEQADSSFRILYKSGMNIGRDVMGTMANTLILAYIGSSLSVVLLLIAYSTSLMYLFNSEMIIVEILQALVGSFGILVTMPLTSLICAFLYTKSHKRATSNRSIR